MSAKRLCKLAALGSLILLLLAVVRAEGGLRPREGDLKVGDRAPDFTLKSPDGKITFTLSAFKGKKPVVLTFGSYT